MPDCPGALHFSDMQDGPMIRLRFPGGKVTSLQLEALYHLSDKSGNGLIDLTNRANLQIRGLKNISDINLKTQLQKSHLLPKNIWADRLRNIMADPIDQKENEGLIDCENLILTLDEQLQQTPSLKDLSPKFCFIIDNGSPLKISNQPHDIAMRAYQEAGEIRFGVLIANQPMFLSVSTAYVVQFMIKIAQFICHYDKSITRAAPLLKILELQNLQGSLQKIAPYCKAQHQPFDTAPQTIPPIGLIPERYLGTMTLGLGIPVARLTAEQIGSLLDLSRLMTSPIDSQHGGNYIKLSPWQIIYVPHIPKKYGQEALQIAKENGFITDPSFLNTQVFACSGTAGCPRTKARCKEEGLELTRQLAISSHKQKAPTRKRVKIHISGCDRGCAFAGKADILALAQTDGSGYTLYSNKSLAEIRAQTTSDSPPLHKDIVQTIMERVDDHLKGN